MNGGELIRVVDLMHRERNISREVIFGAIEKAIRLAITKSFEDEENIEVAIDRHSGEIVAKKGEKVIAPEELGRISAQAAKQAMIQILREAEALLPRGEQIPGETHHVGERVKAIILEVKRNGHRVRIILSRTHPD